MKKVIIPVAVFAVVAVCCLLMITPNNNDITAKIVDIVRIADEWNDIDPAKTYFEIEGDCLC